MKNKDLELKTTLNYCLSIFDALSKAYFKEYVIDFLSLQAIGKMGRIVNIFPDGDLRVMTETAGIWTFNPECVTWLERGPTHSFRKGTKARFKMLPTEEMKRLQEGNGGWIPILEDVRYYDFIIL